MGSQSTTRLASDILRPPASATLYQDRMHSRSVAASLSFPQTRQWMRRTYDAFKFDRAMRHFLDDPEAAIQDGSSVLQDLIDAWGNSGWSALDEYLRVGIEHVLETDDAILECGTGLSTLLFGAVAQSRGIDYWALEHLPEWSDRITHCLERYKATDVRISTRPLRRYAGFDWYDPPLAEMPRSFSLVICDGPPSRTLGGRYGLAAVMRTRLRAGCVVLLDDAEREHERQIARLWQAELGAEAEFLDGRKPLIRLVVRGPAAAAR